MDKWHTGTPTENGYYLCHIRFLNKEDEIEDVYYDMCLNYCYGRWETGNDVEIVAWQRFEPYKETSE